MTIETLNRANEISNRIKDLEESLGTLECRVHIRKRDIKDYKEGNTRWIPIPNWFGKGTVKENNKINLNIPIECRTALEFEIDEECVDFIIKHEREKITKLRKELEEL